MDFNPLTRTYTEIQVEIDALQKSEKQVGDEVQWYSSIDPHALTEDLRRNEATIGKLQLEIQTVEKEIQENVARLGEIAPAIGTLLNPLNWFAKDQVDLRRKGAQLRGIGDQKAGQKQSKVKELEATRARMAKVASDLQRHGTFDFLRRQSDLSKIKQSIASKNEELQIVAEQKRRVDEVLEPLLKEMQNLESKKRRAESDLEDAQDLDRRISSAGNSYERTMLHEQCEGKFGEGSPRRIVVKRQNEIRQLERDYEKAKRRVEGIGQKAARKIDTIVIDGNNLCYEGSNFIGLSAIEQLVPLASAINNLNKLLLFNLMDYVITNACRMHKLLHGLKPSTGCWNRKWTSVGDDSGRQRKCAMLAGVALRRWHKPLVCPARQSRLASVS